MIYTRMGTPIKILSADKWDRTIWLEVEFENGKTREYAIFDLRADSGINEIHQAILINQPTFDFEEV